jgi:hypothetical protein
VLDFSEPRSLLKPWLPAYFAMGPSSVFGVSRFRLVFLRFSQRNFKRQAQLSIGPSSVFGVSGLPLAFLAPPIFRTVAQLFLVSALPPCCLLSQARKIRFSKPLSKNLDCRLEGYLSIGPSSLFSFYAYIVARLFRFCNWQIPQTSKIFLCRREKFSAIFKKGLYKPDNLCYTGNVAGPLPGGMRARFASFGRPSFKIRLRGKKT